MGLCCPDTSKNSTGIGFLGILRAGFTKGFTVRPYRVVLALVLVVVMVVMVVVVMVVVVQVGRLAAGRRGRQAGRAERAQGAAPRHRPAKERAEVR